MTRDELIEKVAVRLQLIAGGEYDYGLSGLSDREAKLSSEDLLEIIFDALKEPTHQMIRSYEKNLSFGASDNWQAMLNASPLVKEV